MRARDRSMLRLFALALITGALFAVAPSGWSVQRLTMAATFSTSPFYAYQVAVANYVNEVVPSVHITVQEIGGAAVATQAVLRGEADMGIAVTESDYAAVRGLKPFNRPNPDLRTLWFFAPLPLNWFVGRDTPIKSLYQLAGQPFNPGGRGTSTENQTRFIFDLLGIKPHYYLAGGDDALEAYQNRRIVGATKAGVHPDAYIQQAHSARPIRMLSLTEAQVRLIIEAAPYFSRAELSGEGFYSGVGSYLTVQTAIGINGHKNIPEKIVYEIARAVFGKRGIEAAARAYSPAARFDPVQLTLSVSVAPLHKGVVRYLTERSIKVPQRLLPPDM